MSEHVLVRHAEQCTTGLQADTAKSFPDCHTCKVTIVVTPWLLRRLRCLPPCACGMRGPALRPARRPTRRAQPFYAPADTRPWHRFCKCITGTQQAEVPGLMSLLKTFARHAAGLQPGSACERMRVHSLPRVAAPETKLIQQASLHQQVCITSACQSGGSAASNSKQRTASALPAHIHGSSRI